MHRCENWLRCSSRSVEQILTRRQSRSGEELAQIATSFFAQPEIPIWGYEGRRDFFDRAKCPQRPYLYMSYEATYTLKCLLFEKITKNSFLASRHAKISFWRFSQKVSILEYMLLHNSYINVAIAVIFLGRKSLYDLHSSKQEFWVMLKNGRGQMSMFRLF